MATGRSARRSTYHHGNLPEALVKASLELIESGGLQQFSLREAARRVGVDPAACYRHYRDRGDLLMACAREGFALLARRMERATARVQDPEAAVTALGRAYVRFALEQPGHFRVMFSAGGPSSRDPRLRGVGEGGKSPFELLVGVLQRWSEADGLELDPEATAMSLWAGAHGVAMLLLDRAWQPASGAESDRLIDGALALMMAGVRRR